MEPEGAKHMTDQSTDTGDDFISVVYAAIDTRRKGAFGSFDATTDTDSVDSLITSDSMPSLIDPETEEIVESPLKSEHALLPVEEDNTQTAKNTNDLLYLCKLYSVGLGLLVGCFIQFSSLGANFLLTVLFGTPAEVPKSKIILFSLGWSFFTSSMGILILLLIVRSLVPIAWTTSMTSRQGAELWSHYSNKRKLSQQHQRSYGGVKTVTLPEEVLLYMECFFAVGALVGVCMAWTFTDILLGFHAHIIHSLVTMVAALAWCKVIAFCFGYDNMKVSKDQNNLTKPLLDSGSDECEADENRLEPVRVPKRLFKLSSLALGLLVGCFIQFSSLGANFLLNVMFKKSAESGHVAISKDEILWFSFVWSFFTSTMGILILVLLRSLVLTSYKAIVTSKVRNGPALSSKNAERMVMHMECFFALGALVGVNCAWIATDAVLGLNMHIWHSLATLVLALLWCKAVAFCFGYCPDDDGEDDEDQFDYQDQATVQAPLLEKPILIV